MKVIERRRLQYIFDKDNPEQAKIAAAAADGEVVFMAEQGFNTTREHCVGSEIAEGRRCFKVWENMKNEG